MNNENVIRFVNEAGKEIVANILFYFQIEELKSDFVAYTINDNEKSEKELVFISKVKYINGKPTYAKILKNEEEIVWSAYNKVLQSILNE